MREFWFGVFGSVLGVLAGMAIVCVIAVFGFTAVVASSLQGAQGADSRLTSDGGHVLEIDLRSGADSSALLAALEAIHRAETDPAIAGAILNVGGDHALALADGESLSRALSALSRNGKPVAAFLEDTGEAGIAAYLAVSAADELWASPLAVITPEVSSDLDSIMLARTGERILSLIAEARDLPTSRVTARLQSGPLGAAAAREAGWVDQLGSSASMRVGLLDAAGGAEPLQPISPEAYLQGRTPESATDAIAFIALEGPLTSDLASRTVEAVDSAVNDGQVRAIVIHVTSASGSPAAAFEVADAIGRAQSLGTPVIAVTGAVASGPAYYAIAPAERIVTPALAALVGLGETDSRLPPGLSEVSDAPTPSPAAAVEQARYTAMLEQVANARDLPLARVAALGRGQIWSGEDAVAYGLADTIGGLHEAVSEARALSGLAPGEPVALVKAPARRTRMDGAVQQLRDALQLP
jgi:ClpP class serine protease